SRLRPSFYAILSEALLRHCRFSIIFSLSLSSLSLATHISLPKSRNFAVRTPSIYVRRSDAAPYEAPKNIRDVERFSAAPEMRFSSPCCVQQSEPNRTLQRLG